MMHGAIPKLKTEGLVKTYRKAATLGAAKKQTFVQALEESNL